MKAQFLSEIKSIHKEKIETLELKIKELPNSLPSEICGINILKNDDFETFSAEKVSSLEEGLNIYQTEEIAIKKVFDDLRINSFVVSTSFFHHLAIGLELFRKYEEYSEILVVKRPKDLADLNMELIGLKIELDKAGIFTKKKVEKAIAEDEEKITNFFLGKTDYDKKLSVLKEMFPELASRSLVFNHDTVNDIKKISKTYQNTEIDKFRRSLMQGIEKLFYYESSIDIKMFEYVFNVSNTMEAYKQWVMNGYSQSCIAVKLNFPEPPVATKEILKKIAANLHKEPWNKGKLCVVADVSAIGIEPMESSLKLIQPIPSCPGLVIEFKNCTVILPDTFYFMEESEKKFLGKIKEVSERWNPVDFLLAIN